MYRREENTFKYLFGKHDGKKPLRRTSCKWEDNVKGYFQNIELGDLDWIRLAYCIE